MVVDKGLKIFVAFLVLTSGASAAIAQAGGGKPKIVLLANDIDYGLAEDFYGFLGNKGMEVVRVTAGEFAANKKEKFIVILGGPDAYDGVGEIVQEVLSDEEEKLIREKGSRKMIVKTNVWRKGQVVHVIAGSDRNQTKKAHEDNKEKLDKNVKGAQDNEVKIQGYRFVPATVTVDVGGIVTWTNKDNAAHTATRSGDFDSGRLDWEDSWSRVFNTVGTFEYHCTYHPYMKGKVIVQPASS
jgi:plastocyanin